MDKLNIIGLLLINSLNKNNAENKKTLITYINKYNEEKEKKINDNIEENTYYLVNYDNIREKNKLLYNEYLQKRLDLYNEWKENKTNNNLIKLLNLNKPIIEEIPDIYTKKRLKTLLK